MFLPFQDAPKRWSPIPLCCPHHRGSAPEAFLGCCMRATGTSDQRQRCSATVLSGVYDSCGLHCSQVHGDIFVGALLDVPAQKLLHLRAGPTGRLNSHTASQAGVFFCVLAAFFPEVFIWSTFPSHTCLRKVVQASSRAADELSAHSFRCLGKALHREAQQCQHDQDLAGRSHGVVVGGSNTLYVPSS